MSEPISGSTTESDALSELGTYSVKEVPTWHGEQDTSRSATTGATSAPTDAHDPQSTPATTSAPTTRLTENTSGPAIAAGPEAGRATEIAALREALNEAMVSMQSAVAEHLCDRLHAVTDGNPCVECSESAADLLNDNWDEQIVRQVYPPASTTPEEG